LIWIKFPIAKGVAIFRAMAVVGQADAPAQVRRVDQNGERQATWRFEMRKLLFAGAAVAAVLLDAAVANAQWSLSYGYRNPAEAWWGGYPVVYPPGILAHGCWYTLVREIRDGQVILRAVPRC
jgi:hypothetical protein